MALEIVTKIQLIRYISRIIKAQCFKAAFVRYDISKYFFHIIIKLDYKHLTHGTKAGEFSHLPYRESSSSVFSRLRHKFFSQLQTKSAYSGSRIVFKIYVFINIIDKIN